MDALRLLELLEIGERVDIECKEAESDIPKSIWESYSSMANTNGGIIVLGIYEDKKTGKFLVKGVKNTDKRIRDFWNTVNSNKVNKNLLMDNDVEIIDAENKKVIVIKIPRAKYNEKPIYINDNPYKGTYKRNYEGDYRCSEEEIKSMIRDSSDEGNDSYIFEDYYIDDIDENTLKKYRNRFATFHPDHTWNEKNNEDFLIVLGAISEDRKKKVKGLTLAGLLMFGKGIVIRELLPSLGLDYREEISDSSETRWSDRFTIDGTWENNLYNFYFSVMPKLTENIKVPFQLENLDRKDDTHVHKAIREAFINSMIHGDYNTQGTIKIIKTKNMYEFVNPGNLKIDKDNIFEGGNSKSRNPRLQLMFRMIGLGENADSGFPTILSAWDEQHWRIPELVEDTNLNHIVLKLWMSSMIPEGCLDQLNNVYGNSINKLDKPEIMALVTALLEESVNNSRLQLMCEEHPYEITKMLHQLTESRYLIVNGYGKGKKYYINNHFLNEEEVFDLTDNEITLVNYIKQKGYVTNKLSRDEIGFGKDKNVDLFNSLMKKNVISKSGSGNKTQYILVESNQ